MLLSGCDDATGLGAVEIGNLFDSPNNGGARSYTNQNNQIITVGTAKYNPVTGVGNAPGIANDQSPPFLIVQSFSGNGNFQLCESRGCDNEVPLMSTQWIYALLALLLGSTLFYVRFARRRATQD